MQTYNHEGLFSLTLLDHNGSTQFPTWVILQVDYPGLWSPFIGLTDKYGNRATQLRLTMREELWITPFTEHGTLSEFREEGGLPISEADPIVRQALAKAVQSFGLIVTGDAPYEKEVAPGEVFNFIDGETFGCAVEPTLVWLQEDAFPGENCRSYYYRIQQVESLEHQVLAEFPQANPGDTFILIKREHLQDRVYAVHIPKA